MGFVRFLLACFVVIFHASPYWKFLPMTGDLSVQCFYVISGFYMTLILNEKYTSADTNFVFYTNRALKIYPIYFTSLIMLLLWAGFVYYRGYPGTFDYFRDYWPLPITTLAYLLFVNIFLIGIDTVFYAGINDNGTLYYTNNINNHQPYVVQFVFNPFAWTIGVELLFYIIAPFILRRKAWLAFLLIFISLFIRFYLVSISLNYPPWNYMFFPNQLMFFMGGALSYHIYKRIKNKPISNIASVSIFAFFLILITTYNQIFKESYFKQTALFCIEVLVIPYIFLFTKNNKIDRFFGNLSFPIYILQALVLKIVVAKSFPKLISYGLTSLLIIIVLSIIVEYVIAQPIEKYRQRRASALKRL
ncbi:MAG: acyltransferase [Bacteroidota bacterium]